MSNSYDILSINAVAKKDAAAGNKVINGCVGTFKDDDHKLVTFPEVIKYLHDNSDDYLEYAPILGTDKFKEGVLRWVFKGRYEVIKYNPNVFFGATIGGTGAIYSIFKYFEKNDGCLVFADVVWPNYFGIARETGVRAFNFPIFDKDNGFNLFGLESAIKEALLFKNYVLVLINDPCENPTGYNMTDGEYNRLMALLQKYNTSGKHVDIMCDIAYGDYSTKEPLIYSMVANKYDFNIYFAFSASKSFGVYGIRCGGLIGFMKDNDEYNKIHSAMLDISRGCISSPNYEAVGTFGKLLADDDACNTMREDLTREREFLAKRGENALRVFDMHGIKYLPYKNGFFITIMVTSDAYKIFDYLETLHIYIVPMTTNSMRVAICSLTDDEVEEIATRIEEFERK